MFAPDFHSQTTAVCVGGSIRVNWLISALCVTAGGALGTLARVLLAESLQASLGVPAWIGILVVNVLGCFLIGLLFIVLEITLRRDGKSRLRGTSLGQTLEHIPGVVREDPTLDAVDYFRADLRLRLVSSFLLTGFLGGFTTFSSYMLFTDQLVRAGDTRSALLNLAASVLLGLLAVALGMRAGAGGRFAPLLLRNHHDRME